jgi:hypothetical protein
MTELPPQAFKAFRSPVSTAWLQTFPVSVSAVSTSRFEGLSDLETLFSSLK